jgi:hypothetical protein
MSNLMYRTHRTQSLSSAWSPLRQALRLRYEKLSGKERWRLEGARVLQWYRRYIRFATLR